MAGFAVLQVQVIRKKDLGSTEVPWKAKVLESIGWSVDGLSQESASRKEKPPAWGRRFKGLNCSRRGSLFRRAFDHAECREIGFQDRFLFHALILVLLADLDDLLEDLGVEALYPVRGVACKSP